MGKYRLLGDYRAGGDMRLKSFKIGDLVRLQHCHEVQGIIVDVRECGTVYKVLWNGKNKWSIWHLSCNVELVCE